MGSLTSGNYIDNFAYLGSDTSDDEDYNDSGTQRERMGELGGEKNAEWDDFHVDH